MSNEVETSEYTQPEINWDVPISYEASASPITQPPTHPWTATLAQEDIHQMEFPVIENFFPPLANPSAIEMANTRINLEPEHAKNADLSNITKREDREEFNRVVDTMAMVIANVPDLTLSHVIYMVKEKQYEKVRERACRNAFFVMERKQNKVQIFKSPKKILTGVGQWDIRAECKQEQGYMWVFSVPKESVEFAFQNMVTIFYKNNLMTLRPEFSEEDPYTLFLTRYGWKYAISLVPIKEAE